ncbi:MAG: hypothetical protein J2P46_05815 [Zavarzinella sp.]|nr:hypothetical protein [Zavarzinella sp.]
MTSRERQAESLSRWWSLGLFVFPILIFLILLWRWVLTSDGRLRPEFRRSASRAAAFIFRTAITYGLVSWATASTGSR